MEILKEAIISIDKPFFIYNKITMVIKVYPTIVEPGNKSITTFDPTTDEPFIKDTIEEVMVEFDRLGFMMPEEDTWDFPEKSIRVFITHEQNTLIMQSVYGLDLLTYFKQITPPIVSKIAGIYIYLNEIFPDHKGLLESFGAVITINS